MVPLQATYWSEHDATMLKRFSQEAGLENAKQITA